MRRSRAPPTLRAPMPGKRFDRRMSAPQLTVRQTIALKREAASPHVPFTSAALLNSAPVPLPAAPPVQLNDTEFDVGQLLVRGAGDCALRCLLDCDFRAHTRRCCCNSRRWTSLCGLRSS